MALGNLRACEENREYHAGVLGIASKTVFFFLGGNLKYIKRCESISMNNDNSTFFIIKNEYSLYQPMNHIVI